MSMWKGDETKKQELKKRSCVDVPVHVQVHIHVLVSPPGVDRFPEEGLGRNAVAVSVAVLSSSLDT